MIIRSKKGASKLDKTERMSAAAYRKTLCGGNAEVSYKNRISSDNGRSFEEIIKKGCEYYAESGRAVISKVHEPYIVTKILQGGVFLGRFTGRAEPDFKGTIYGGKSIAFEAKSTQKTRINRIALTNEQMRWLSAQYSIGALAYVCVNIRDKFFMIPWVIWRDMRKIYKRHYLTAEDIPQYEIQFDGTLKFLDYVWGSCIGRSIDG